MVERGCQEGPHAVPCMLNGCNNRPRRLTSASVPILHLQGVSTVVISTLTIATLGESMGRRKAGDSGILSLSKKALRADDRNRQTGTHQPGTPCLEKLDGQRVPRPGKEFRVLFVERRGITSRDRSTSFQGSSTKKWCKLSVSRVLYRSLQ